MKTMCLWSSFTFSVLAIYPPFFFLVFVIMTEIDNNVVASFERSLFGNLLMVVVVFCTSTDGAFSGMIMVATYKS